MPIGDKKKCEFCHRDGIVIISKMMPAIERFGIPDYLFEFSLCQYHKGSWMRIYRRKKVVLFRNRQS